MNGLRLLAILLVLVNLSLTQFISQQIGVNAVGFGRVYMKKLTRPNTCGLSIF
ncbi:hypothetical protein ACJIZ3_012442 [Penstemon smallii]|uniref:Uncharacterized protein n=1 Tax=Penstemon smallii TaxID=265156 RepID=A0ABD3UNB8_9LAMI